MMEELAYKKIRIGTRVEVKKKSPFDQSLEVKVGNQLMTITEQLAKQLFVKKV
jgi:Fe2+ transport system protein FeoA